MEKRAIVHWILENRLGLSRSQILIGTPVRAAYADFTPEIQRLNQGEPLQYILGYSEFLGRRFEVSAAVLIPRPETELMIEIALETLTPLQGPRIWDIGTGSGCIAVTLALELKNARVYGSDVSKAALEVARGNAARFGADVEFVQHNILEDPVSLEQLDAIVSNPPYIRSSERSGMSSSVTGHEPETALFVPDEDPLLFHRVIADKSLKALNHGGLLVLEINEALGPASAAALSRSGFQDVAIRKDLDGKDRFVFGFTPR